MKHTKHPTSFRFKRAFMSFDLAWEYMHFVAKMIRSTDVHARVINDGLVVVVEIENLHQPRIEDFKRGLKDYFKEEKSDKVVKKSTYNNAALLYTDGGSRGNPGPSASGFVIYDQARNELATGGTFLGITTNNQAEYHSLRDGLKRAHELGYKEVTIYMDSQLVVSQVEGEYKVKNRDLYPLYESVMGLLNKFEAYEINHIPRELNKKADSIVNDILDQNVTEVS